jgi:hypothetical protein
MKVCKIAITLIGMGLGLASQTAMGAAAKKIPSPSSSKGGRDWLFSLPLIAERPQLRIHAEYNADRSVGLALEAGVISAVEELSDEEILLTGNSLQINGMQASILMSRYSDEANMAGFFWSLGAGYRRWQADWKKQVTDKESFRLAFVDEKGYLHHKVEGKGATGHIRLGYRYVGSDWPLAFGAHVGIRHMNSQVTDVDVSEADQEKLKLQYSDLNPVERRSMKHRMMTQPDITVDFGLVF